MAAICGIFFVDKCPCVRYNTVRFFKEVSAMKTQMIFSSVQSFAAADAVRILPRIDAALILAVSICLALLRIIQ